MGLVYVDEGVIRRRCAGTAWCIAFGFMPTSDLLTHNP
jgi:hypothetical protein